MLEIDFDSEVNIEYVKSILHRIFNNYSLFSQEDIEEQILVVEEVKIVSILVSEKGGTQHPGQFSHHQK